MTYVDTLDATKYMMLLSSFMIGILAILFEAGREMGSVISYSFLLEFTALPMFYIFSFFALSAVGKRQAEKKYQLINKLSLVVVLLLGIFLFIMATHSYWIGYLGKILLPVIYGMVLIATVIFGISISTLANKR